MQEGSHVSHSEDIEQRLGSIVAAVAASHSKFAAADVAEVLQLALDGAQLAAPSPEWVQETAEDISDGSIVPITSNRGLEMSQLFDRDS